MLLEEERQGVVDACVTMIEKGLVVGTAGNVSVRVGDLVAISPSGVDYYEMKAEDVCVLDMEGNQVDGDLLPSSEAPLHLSVYNASPTVGAITHNHAIPSTSLGLVVDEIPTSHYYSAMFGGPIRVAGYARFGSTLLAENVTAALKDRNGALMANHGAITTGPTLEKALSLLPYLEYICQVQLNALSTGLPIKVLDQEAMDDATAAISTYGKQPKHDK